MRRKSLEKECKNYSPVRGAQRLIHDSLVQHPQSPINPTSFYHEVAYSGPNKLIALALHPELARYLNWTESSQALDGLQTWMSMDPSRLRFLQFEVRIAGQEGAVAHGLLSYSNNGLQNIADLTARSPYLDNGLQNTTDLTASITYPIPGTPITVSLTSLLPNPILGDRVPKLFEDAEKSIHTKKSVPTPTYQSPTSYSSTPITGTHPETVHPSTSIVRWGKKLLGGNCTTSC